jgi:hypothetical protein
MRISRNGRWGIVAVVAVALIAAGAAYAATQFHGSSSANGRGGFGGRMRFGSAPGFAPPAGTYGAPRSGRGFGSGGFGFRRSGDGLSAAAGYLGLSETALSQQLQPGKTLAQIANGTSGKSAAGLIEAMVTAQQSEIAAALKSGRLPEAMADRLTADLKARVTALVNGTFGPGRGFGFRAPNGSTAPTNI